MRIAVDGMGGDRAPQVVVEGAVQAAREYGFEVILVGDETLLRSELEKWHHVPSNLSIQHAGSLIRMDEPAAASVRKKKDASICVAAELAKEGKVDAVVTAGHTGAAVVACTLKWRLIEGVERPGIGVVFPTLQGPTMLIDVGANIDIKPNHLLQYAIMGDVYFRYIMKKNRPSIGVLNIGEEETKGVDYVKEAHQLLNSSKLHFIGNVEGRDIFNGSVDIVVCDGFVGNVVLKVAESIAGVISTLLKRELSRNYLTMAGAFLSKSAFNALKREIDHSEYGGAPLLGIDGTCIISHGSSNPKAIKNAIRVAAEFVKYEINKHIREGIQDSQNNHDA